MTLPAILGLILTLVTGEAKWIVLIGVFLVMGVALDQVIYNFVVRWQPPWMSGVLGLVELGLLLVLAAFLDLGLGIVEAIVFYLVSWVLFYITKIALLPIVSLTYVESAAEFRRTAWSIPPSKEQLPLIAATDAGDLRPGKVLEQASGAHAIPLPKQPGLSGAHQIPADLARG